VPCGSIDQCVGCWHWIYIHRCHFVQVPENNTHT
jgi:hypothetical protein